MNSRYSIFHELKFSYESAVTRSVFIFYVAPAHNFYQLVRRFSHRMDPGGTIFPFAGPYGNRGHFLIVLVVTFNFKSVQPLTLSLNSRFQSLNVP